MTQYTLAGRIESGELADLYRATRSDGHSVMVKLFHPRTSDQAYAKDLAGTVRALGPVRHPGIVTTFELGLVKQRLAVVSDDVAKVNLGQALTRLNTKEVLLAPGLAVAMALELLEALGLAHQAGVLHGGITPGNVLLTPEGHCAIRDFGALKALFACKPLAQQFGARGRSAYRAPENTRGDELSIEGDLYSVAAILYSLLTLKEPSTGEGSNVSTRRAQIPPPSRIDRRLNARLDPVLMRALDSAPARRYRSAHDFAQGLRDFLAANGGLPPRDEARRFVTTLFPAEVNIEHLGPVPFAESFVLDEVTGANLDLSAEHAPEPAPRKPFISSELPTQNALPVLDEPPSARTQPELPRAELAAPAQIPMATVPMAEGNKTLPLPNLESQQFPTWVAPSASAPVKKAGRPEESDSGTRALERRVRVIEDFQALEKKKGSSPDRPPGSDSGPIPQPAKERLVLPTSEIPMERVHEDLAPPKPKPSAPAPSAPRLNTDERLIKAQVQQRRTIALYALGIALLGAGAFYFFALRNSDRVMPQWRPIAGAPTVKAPPFRPDLREKDPKEKESQKDPPKVATKEKDAEQPAAPKEPCYDGPPKKKAALLTVTASKGMMVRIDGEKLCGGDFSKVPIEPGKRKITVTEGGKGGQTFEATQRFELGKETRIVPVFHGR
jgi:eukaryotic-like serine/threonine-protein kinase